MPYANLILPAAPDLGAGAYEISRGTLLVNVSAGRRPRRSGAADQRDHHRRGPRRLALGPVAAAQEANAERTAAYRGQHVPDAVADDHGRFNRSVQPFGGREKQVRVGFCIFDLVARHDWNPIRIDTERVQIDGRGFHAAAGGDRAGNAGLQQPFQQFAGSRQRPDVLGLLPVSGRMGLTKAFDALGADLNSGLAEQLVGEQAPAHADLAMNAPDRQFDALRVERLLPGKDVLIDAVNEGAVEIKQEDRFDAHATSPVLELRTTSPALPRSRQSCHATWALPRLTVWRTSNPSNCG